MVFEEKEAEEVQVAPLFFWSNKMSIQVMLGCASGVEPTNRPHWRYPSVDSIIRKIIEPM